MTNKKVKYLVLWVSNKCNLNCIYCYAKNNMGNELMEFNIAKEGIDILEDGGTLIFAGGEPLTNFVLIERICEYIKNIGKKVKISMQTNGTLITHGIAEKIRKYNIGVGVSLDGIPKINEELRGMSRQVIEGIGILKSSGITINVNAVITKLNVKHLSELVDLAIYLENVGGIGLDLLREAEISNRSIKATYDEVYNGIKEIYWRSKELGKLTGRYISIREVEDARFRVMNEYSHCHYCYASKGEACVIVPNGDMYACSSLVGDREYYFGNILGEYSIGALKDISFHECKSCKYKKMCKKMCPSRAILNFKEGIISKEECALRKACYSLIESEH